MRKWLCIVAVVALCGGCASTGRVELGRWKLDVKSEERVAIEVGAKGGSSEDRFASNLVKNIIDIIPLKLGIWEFCCVYVEWGEDGE